MRHTHASLLIAEGVHAKKIAERLGHSSIKLTMDTYGHLFEGSDHESAERMDRLFGALSAKEDHRQQHRANRAKVIVFRKPGARLNEDKNEDQRATAATSLQVMDKKW